MFVVGGGGELLKDAKIGCAFVLLAHFVENCPHVSMVLLYQFVVLSQKNTYAYNLASPASNLKIPMSIFNVPFFSLLSRNIYNKNSCQIFFFERIAERIRFASDISVSGGAFPLFPMPIIDRK